MHVKTSFSRLPFLVVAANCTFGITLFLGMGVNQAYASLPTFPCKVEFFFDKGSSLPLGRVTTAGREFDVGKQALEQFKKYNDLGLGDQFYVEGNISGSEDRSPNHDVAVRRAQAVRSWLLKQGVPADRIFAYALVPESQTPFGNGNGLILFCDKRHRCGSCPIDFAQRDKVLDGPGFVAEMYPVLAD